MVAFEEGPSIVPYADYSLLYEGRQTSMYRGLFHNDSESLFWRLNDESMFKGLLGSQLPALQIQYVALKFFPISLRLDQVFTKEVIPLRRILLSSVMSQ